MSTYSGSMYVRLRSYGNYHGRGWLAAEEYAGSISYGGESYGMNYLTGIALANSGRSAERAYINVKSENYLLPYYMGLGNAGYVVQSSDVKYIGDTSYIYAVDYIPYDYIAEGAVYGRLGNYYTQEAAYSQFVYGNYLTVPTATAQYLNALIAEQGLEEASLAKIGVALVRRAAKDGERKELIAALEKMIEEYKREEM